MPSTPGDEDPARFIDPDLLDARIVEQRLQRAEAGDRVEHCAGGCGDVPDGRQRRGDGAVLVVGDDVVDHPRHGRGLGDRVDATTPHELAHLVLENRVRACHREPPAPAPVPTGIHAELTG